MTNEIEDEISKLYSLRREWKEHQKNNSDDVEGIKNRENAYINHRRILESRDDAKYTPDEGRTSKDIQIGITRDSAHDKRIRDTDDWQNKFDSE